MDINNTGTSSSGVQDRCDWWHDWDENGHWGCTYSCSDLWHRFFGNTTGQLILSDNASAPSKYMYKWLNASGYNVYFADYDSVIDWDQLQAIGKNTTDQNSTNDFIELDAAFYSSGFPDNITYTYSPDGTHPKEIRNYTIYGTNVSYVPIANSTTNSTFRTGIMWDMSDGGTEYGNAINQSTVWVVNVTEATTDVYGIYDYLGSIPYTLATYEGSNNQIAVYVEIK